jgi:hypothetical protein
MFIVQCLHSCGLYWAVTNVRVENIHATHFSQLNTGLKFLTKLAKINTEKNYLQLTNSSKWVGPAHIHYSVFVCFTQLKTTVQQSLYTRYSHTLCDVTLCILIMASVLEETAACSSAWKKKEVCGFLQNFGTYHPNLVTMHTTPP